MIINTGGRTDTVNYYSDWLLKRFGEGYVYSCNPLFPNHITKYRFDPSVVPSMFRWEKKTLLSVPSPEYRMNIRFPVSSPSVIRQKMHRHPRR